MRSQPTSSGGATTRRAKDSTGMPQKPWKNVVVSLRTCGVGLVMLALLYFYFLWVASKAMLQPQSTNIGEDGDANERSKQSATSGRLVEKPYARSESIQQVLSPKTPISFKKMTTRVPVVQLHGVTIAIASTVTGCGEEPFTEGAAVLKHAIHRTSIHGTMGGRYDYKMYIIYHPNAMECTLPLADLGFELIQRDTPVNVSQIQGDVLRERIASNGCCGEKELIKLEAYTLIQHPIVVLLDLDVLVLQPMDAVFDLMLSEEPNPDTSNVPLMWPDRQLPRPVKIFWTKDYNVVLPSRKNKPTQGGLLILRPDMDVYHEFVEIVLKGDYDVKKGWGGAVGPFYGGM
jgi:hypothetical protein